MGMFDTILTPDLRCVMCGRDLPDLQTKSGDCILHEYEIGDKFPLRENLKYIEAYTSCVHEWVLPTGSAKELGDVIGLMTWQAVHGIWIDVKIPLDKYGRITYPDEWRLEYRKARMGNCSVFTDMDTRTGGKMPDPRQYTARIGDAIMKYYGTVDDELWWKDVTE